MKTPAGILFLAVLLVCLPIPVVLAAADSHGHAHAHAEGAAADEEGAVVIGNQTIKGLNGKATLRTLPADAAPATHRFVFTLADAKTKNPPAAVPAVMKVTDPKGAPLDPYELVVAEGEGNADLAFDKKGVYHFRIDVSVDGQVRKYHFHYSNR